MATPATITRPAGPASQHAGLEVGNLVASWRLVKALRRPTQWGMADVWLVEHHDSGQRGVLKVAGYGLDPETNSQALMLSIREAGILDQLGMPLNHPRLPRLFATCEFDGRHAFVREHIDGPSIANIVRQQGPIPWPIAVNYALDLAWIIAFMDARGINNRDIKPDNVLVRDGDACMFDLSVSGGPGYPFPKGWSQPTGTPGYSLPEQLIEQAPVYGGDTWALMATLYYMLAGCGPFDGKEELVEIVMLSESREFPPLPSCIPPELRSLVDQVLRSRPPRCANADYIIGRLRAVLGLHSLGR